MATFKLMRSCCCRSAIWPSAIGGVSQRKPWSTVAQSSANYRQDQTEHITLNPPRKKRDRLTVLRVLASTVEATPGKPAYGFYDDPVLNPRSSLRQREVRAALASGEQAADFVMKKYPELFRLRQPVPAWPQEDVPPFGEKSVSALQQLIKTSKNVDEVMVLYEELKKGDTLPMWVHNQVLDFLAFNASSYKEKAAKEGESTSSSDEGESQSSSDEEEAKMKSEKDPAWSNNCPAEKLFAELGTVANGQTYEVFILGLLRHGETIRAFHLFNEMKSKQFAGSTFLMSALLRHVCSVRSEDKDRWDLAEDIVAHMKLHKIQPGLGTFNALLEIACNMTEKGSLTAQRIIREMKQMNIAPSLGSYHFLLEAEKKEKSSNLQVLKEVLADLRPHREHEIADPADVAFFETAMGVARFKKSAKDARELCDLVMTGNNRQLLARKSSSFFGNYLCCLASSERDIQTVFAEYDKIVPKVLTPREWVYEELFKSCDRLRDASWIPKLYRDMVSLRVRLSAGVCEALFSALNADIPAERVDEYLLVATDCAKWMGIFEIPTTALVLSATMRLYCLKHDYEGVKVQLKKLLQLNLSPSFSAISSVLAFAVEMKDGNAVLDTLTHMRDWKFTLSDAQKDLLLTSDFLKNKIERIQVLIGSAQH